MQFCQIQRTTNTGRLSSQPLRNKNPKTLQTSLGQGSQPVNTAQKRGPRLAAPQSRLRDPGPSEISAEMDKVMVLALGLGQSWIPCPVLSPWTQGCPSCWSQLPTELEQPHSHSTLCATGYLCCSADRAATQSTGGPKMLCASVSLAARAGTGEPRLS